MTTSRRNLSPSTLAALATITLSLSILFSAPILANAPLSEDAPPKCEDLAQWMPSDVFAVGRINALSSRIDTLLGSQLRKNFEATNVGKYLLALPQYEVFFSKLEEFRNVSGVEARTLLNDLLGRDVVVGGRLTFVGIPEVLVLTRLDGEEGIKRSRAAFDRVIEKQFGREADTRKSEHAGYTIESISVVHFSQVGDVWMASNSPGMIENAIDLAKGSGKRSVARSKPFARVLRAKKDSDFIRLAVRPRLIPNFKIPKQLDNPVASLLFGGLAGALNVSDVIGATLAVEGDSLSLRTVTVADERGLAKDYDSFFPKTLANGVERRLRRRGVLGMIRIHRDLSQWWEDAEKFMEPRAAGGLTEFAGTLSLFFGGRNFRDEVLPELGDTITLAFRNQTYKDVGATPAPAIPGIAAIFELKNADEFGRAFKVAFNTIVGIINVDRMQKDKDASTMLVQPKLIGETECYTVDMGLPKSKSGKPGIEYNFTPSLAVVGDHVVLSSSFELLSVLVEEIGSAKNASKKGSGKTGVAKAARDRIVIDAGAVQSIVQENRDFFASQNMVKKGIEIEEARAEIDTVLELVDFLRSFELVSYRKDDAVHLNLRLRFADATKKGATKTAALNR